MLLLLLCLGAGAYVQQNYADIALFLNRPVTKVRMDQQWQKLSAAEIRLLLSGSMGKGFFDIDVADLKSKLEQHPWVAQAAVKRIWPDSLALQITEHTAIARWGEAKLLNQYGEIFSPATQQEFSHLPKLRGPEQRQFQVMQQYQQFSQILFPSGLRLSELYQSDRGSWELEVNDSMRVIIGRKDLKEKLERFVKFYESQPKTTAELFQSVDLRYGNGIAVKRREPDLTGVAIR